MVHLPEDVNLRPEHWLGHYVEATPNERAAAIFFARAVLSAKIIYTDPVTGKAAASPINSVRTRTDIHDNTRRFEGAAEVCRAMRDDPFLALALPGLDAADKAALTHVEALIKAALLNIKRATANHPLVVDRFRHNDVARAAVRELAMVTRKMFGRPLWEVLATTASVLFDDKIKVDAVRDWVNPKGGNKEPA